MTFSPDSRWLVLSGGAPRVVDTTTWRTHCLPTTSDARGLAFSPDSEWLVVGTSDGEVAIWDVPGCHLERRLVQGGESIGSVAVSPDGLLVAAEGSRSDGADLVWRAATGKLQARLLDHRHGVSSSIKFDPTSKLVVHGGTRGTLFVSDALSGITLSMLTVVAAGVPEVQFSRDSRRLLGAVFDGTARLWDVGGSLPKLDVA